MLSDHEWKTLREVELQFRAEDPGFRRSFDTRARHLRREDAGSVSIKTAVVVAFLLGGLMLAAGSPGGALAFAAVVWLIWLAWRRSNDPSRRST